jgi:hypothetical protein
MGAWHQDRLADWLSVANISHIDFDSPEVSQLLVSRQRARKLMNCYDSSSKAS